MKNQKKRKASTAYSVVDVQKALDAVKKGASILAASKSYNVPYATLHSRVKGKYPIEAKRGPSTVLSSDEEKELVRWILNLSKCGFPATKEVLLNSVQQFIIKTGRCTPFTNGRPSRHWYQAFLKRNSELSEKVCQNLNKARASVSEKNIREWFAQIYDYLGSRNVSDITAERVFNIDESAFCLNPKNGKVLVRRGEKACYNVCGNEKECYTALIGGNAAGMLLPTMIIYKQERISSDIVNNFPDDFIIGRSESGWMTSETFFSYIANHMYEWCISNNINFPILLFVDGHSSHLTKGLSDFCSEHNIELIALFPNATHIMQPMDVALFHPLKSSYREAVRSWRMEHDGVALTKPYFASVLKTALLSLDTKEIFKNGFRRCGLFPFSPDSINYNKLITFNDGEASNVTDPKESTNFLSVESSQDLLSQIESNISSDVLQKFKNNESEEWIGDIEYKELYNFWQSFKNTKFVKACNNEKDNENVSSNLDLLEGNSQVFDDNSVVIEELEVDDSNSISFSQDTEVLVIAVNNSVNLEDNLKYQNIDEKVSCTFINENAVDWNIVDKLSSNSCSNNTLLKRGKTDLAESSPCNEHFVKAVNSNISSDGQAVDMFKFVSLTTETAHTISNIPSDTLHSSSYKLEANESATTTCDFNTNTDTSLQNYGTYGISLSANSPCTPAYKPERSISANASFQLVTNTVVTLPNSESSSNDQPIDLTKNHTLTTEDTLPMSNIMINKHKEKNSVPVPSTSCIIPISDATPKIQSELRRGKITDFLYLPKKEIKEKKKRFKSDLPYSISGPEFRAIKEAKEKEQEELEQKKKQKKLHRDYIVKIKQEVQENLKQITPNKINVKSQLKELQIKIEKQKAEKRLLEIELKHEQHHEEVKKSLEGKIKILKDKINDDTEKRKEMIQLKNHFIQEEKKIKALNKRTPLGPLNLN